MEISQEQKIKTINSEDLLTIVTAYEQISEKLKLILESSDHSKYKAIIDLIFWHLNYKEIESLLDSVKDNSNWPVFLAEFSKEKYIQEEGIESFYLNQIEEARLSLCTSDFMAFIIGKKCDLQVPLNENSIWSEVYTKINTELNGYLIREKMLCIEESNKKANVPINYALSMFFLHDKKTAISKFKRILSNDREHRLEVGHEAEYFLITEKFFNRLKLDFIPQINLFNDLHQINFENDENQFISRDELKIIYDREDFFNKREFCVDKKKLLNSRKIVNMELITESYHMFFKSLDNTLQRKKIEILISCFTEINPKFEEIEIGNARSILNNLLIEHKQHVGFIYLNYYLFYHKNEFTKARHSLSFLLSEFFNKVDGMRPDSIKDVFYRKYVNCEDILDRDLLNFMKT